MVTTTVQHDAPTYTIRRATASDLDAAARLRAVSWQQSFADFLPASTLDGFVESPWTRFVADEWRDLLATGTGEVWLAEDTEGVLVGVAQAEADTSPDAPAPVKLSKLYLLDRAKGSGLAPRLMQCAIGDGPAYLWVLDGNARGRRFYERHGFVADGTHVHLLDDLRHIREIRMVRPGVPVSEAVVSEAVVSEAAVSEAVASAGPQDGRSATPVHAGASAEASADTVVVEGDTGVPRTAPRPA